MMTKKLLQSLSLTSLMLLIGCAHSQVEKTVVSDFGSSSEDDQMEFWHRLSESKIASNDDAFHAILLYADGKDGNGSYEARVKELSSRSMLPSGFNQPANQGVERGTVAVALVKLLQLRGGFMLQMNHLSPRYATRELYFEGLYPISSPEQVFTGNELVGIIGKIDDYQQGDPANKPAALLAGESGK